MPIHPELQDKIGKLTNLPTLPGVAAYLLKAVNDPDSSAADVGRIVAQDASLSAKIIRLANSAYYGIPRSVTNVNNAVVILGLKVINVIVLSLTVFDMFPSNGKKPLFDRRNFWRHCLCCGALARMLAQKMPANKLNVEDAFCAGVLHDIGKIVMEQYLHSDFQRSLAHSAGIGMPFVEAEETLLKFTHTDVAEWLIECWELPENLHNSIVYHHSPVQEDAGNPYACLCHLADYYAYDPRIQDKERSLPAPPFAPEALSVLGLTNKDADIALEELPGVLKSMNVFMEMVG